MFIVNMRWQFSVEDSNAGSFEMYIYYNFNQLYSLLLNGFL